MSSRVLVEVRISNENKVPVDVLAETLKPRLAEYLNLNRDFIDFEDSFEVSNCEELKDINELFVECETLPACNALHASDFTNAIYNFYRPIERSVEVELFDECDEGAAGDDKAGVQAANHWLLPATKFVGLWESLIFDADVKEKILRYCLAALMLGRHKVNSNIITCNRLILLHGPPGTGKTSLCRAVAQKLAIRTRSIFRNTHLIEINSHSLFSKWFSESGKLVLRLFEKIRDLIADPKNLVCVLIDEVESLAYARDSMASQEPKDAMRVVNALLTQLDSIREHPNVFVLTTSNLSDTIDQAFLDRADIKQYIGLPGQIAIRRMANSIFKELTRAEIFENDSDTDNDRQRFAAIIEQLALHVGLNGRSIRKIPFLVFSRMSLVDLQSERTPFSKFLQALREYANVELNQRNKNLEK